MGEGEGRAGERRSGRRHKGGEVKVHAGTRGLLGV